MRRRRPFGAAAAALLLLAGCSGGTTGLGSDAQDATECANATGMSATIDADQLDQLAGHPQLSGDVTITILAREDPPKTFQDPFTGQTIDAEGMFVGYRYRLGNDTNAELQPATQINESLRLTDGDRSWSTADYTGAHPQDVSSSWADTQGDEQTATFVGAGFEQTTWAVFDVPTEAKPNGVALELRADQTCLAVPPE
jgi:hypothetical protein